MPGHVRASMNWNELRSAYKDNYSLAKHGWTEGYCVQIETNPNELYKHSISN